MENNIIIGQILKTNTANRQSKASKPKQISIGRTVKLISKVSNKIILPSRINNKEVLIVLLAKLLDNNWEKKQISTLFTSIDHEDILDIGLNPSHIFVISPHKANFTDSHNFV